MSGSKKGIDHFAASFCNRSRWDGFERYEPYDRLPEKLLLLLLSFVENGGTLLCIALPGAYNECGFKSEVFVKQMFPNAHWYETLGEWKASCVETEAEGTLIRLED